MLHCLQSLGGSLLIRAVLCEALCMDIRVHENDVRKYITDRICLSARLAGMLVAGNFRGEVIEWLTKESQGM
ncbi:hypothetical protein SERLADRAFT_371575 [Serpula lacrymans var. lacrymans S7.9]|uniref:Uncharacterized protein n=1 Tax=Serpula lacrymans var. lacrymans (strain S7.9) TaxID=578457 RepID=F8P3K1_SERL9|nr:uncharacterized protein SERLADRAFT_371575 [Serpula lacrymans var. lacrymans S7.9]EGO22100.1 hypothetical protein SERLADRAFT_371575 [Serpula lacrymans var. lacrymans S7.9]